MRLISYQTVKHAYLNCGDILFKNTYISHNTLTLQQSFATTLTDHNSDSTIITCFTGEASYDFSKSLKSFKFSVLPYHHISKLLHFNNLLEISSHKR